MADPLMLQACRMGPVELMLVHPTAFVDPSARIGSGTRIGPFASVEANVVLGSNNEIGSYAVVRGNTVIGDRNRISSFAVLGCDPQSDSWSGEEARLVLGGNWIREHVTISGGYASDLGTRLGSRNMLMAYSHVGHDCTLGDNIHMANGATLGGHVEVRDFAWLGGLCAVHQSSRVGQLSFIAGGSIVTQDVPPFCLVQGDRARLISLNAFGLKRNGMGSEQVAILKRAFRFLFAGPGHLRERLEAAPFHFGSEPLVLDLVTFLQTSHRTSLVTLRRAA